MSDFSEDDFVDVDNVLNNDTKHVMFEYLFIPQSFNDSINKINENSTEKVDDNNTHIDKRNSARKHRNFMKAKYTENRQFIQRHKHLSPVEDGENGNTESQEFMNKTGMVATTSVIVSENDLNQEITITRRSHNELEQILDKKNTTETNSFDELESDDEEDKIIKKEVQSNVGDYVQVPAYEMGNIYVKNASKFT